MGDSLNVSGSAPGPGWPVHVSISLGVFFKCALILWFLSQGQNGCLNVFHSSYNFTCGSGHFVLDKSVLKQNLEYKQWTGVMEDIHNIFFFSGNATEVLFHITVMSLDTIDESSMVRLFVQLAIIDFYKHISFLYHFIYCRLTHAMCFLLRVGKIVGWDCLTICQPSTGQYQGFPIMHLINYMKIYYSLQKFWILNDRESGWSSRLHARFPSW